MSAIAPLTLEDHDEWMPLWRAYLEFYETELSDPQSELTFARLTSADEDAVHGALVRDDAGAAVGFVHWLTHPSTWSDGPYCYLEDLFVEPGARGTGVGEALIAHVREWARENGSPKLYWLTQRTNARARRLYDRVAVDTGFVHYEIDLEVSGGSAS